MSIKEKLRVNSRLPFHEEYQEKMDEVRFLRLSYIPTGTEYTQGKAADGEKIIHKMECEEQQDWKNRTAQTPVRHYVSTIINKYNSAVFRNEASRDLRGQLEMLYVSFTCNAAQRLSTVSSTQASA